MKMDIGTSVRMPAVRQRIPRQNIRDPMEETVPRIRCAVPADM